MTGELTIRREAVAFLTEHHYPARQGEQLVRYKNAGEGDPPTSSTYIFGGQVTLTSMRCSMLEVQLNVPSTHLFRVVALAQVDNRLVHETIFEQVQEKPPLTYHIEVKQDIYFTIAVQEIIESIKTQVRPSFEALAARLLLCQPSVCFF